MQVHFRAPTELLRQPPTEVIELTQIKQPAVPAFGEFLVTHQVLDRFQLFRVLQMQDRVPNARLGQCAVALGYLPRSAVERLHVRFSNIRRLATVSDDQLDSMPTESFERTELERDSTDVDPVPRVHGSEPEIEIEIAFS